MNSKVLFLLKRKENFDPGVDTHIGITTGLYNSATFMKDMLNNQNIPAELEICIDNNCIDRLVTKHRPKFAIIEALWVVPSKFAILQKLHPTVTWIIRIHSEMPFMAGEGSAMDWIGDYSNCKNVVIACNAPRMLGEIRRYLCHKNDWTPDETNSKVIYLPNYYPKDFISKSYEPINDTIKIGCFGAIRPLKNHLLQAHAALEFAKHVNKKLEFHINSNRLEMKGDSVLNNLHGLFQHMACKGHQLIGHLWAPREQFLKICAEMDLGMQVTFSETFNIVGADVISQGVPLVGSNEIPWSDDRWNADPANSEDIFNKLVAIHNNPLNNVIDHQLGIVRYDEETITVWTNYFKE